MRRFVRAGSLVVVAIAMASPACGGPDDPPPDAPPPSSAKELTSFAFLTANNPTLAKDVMGTISGTTVTLVGPIGTLPAGLVATFSTTGTRVDVNGNAQTSDVTSNDFAGPLTYVVTAEDTSTTDYAIQLTIASVTAPFTFVAGMQPYAIEIADIDGDGKRDLVVGEFANPRGLELLLNNTAPGASAPSFESPRPFAMTNGESVFDVAVADFNIDGKPDVAVAGSVVHVAINTSDPATPSFATSMSTNVVGDRVATGDLNADQKPDLLVAKAGAADVVTVLLDTTAAGATTPTFAQPVPLTTGSAPTSIAIGDLNDDAKPDLAVANNNAGTVSVFLSTTSAGATTPSFLPKVDFAAGSISGRVAIADVNADGKLDLIASNNGAGSISIWLNTTASGSMTPTFMPREPFTTADCPRGMVVADFNEDDRPDVLTSTASCGGSIALLTDLTPTGATMSTFSPMIRLADAYDSADLAVGDLDGDMHLDVASIVTNAGQQSGGHVFVLLSQ